MQLGSTAIGIATKEGVVLAVEKRITSPLLVSGTEAAGRYRGPRALRVAWLASVW